MTQVGPGDVPNMCAACRTITLHRPGADGRLHCLPCMMRLMQPQPPAPAAPQSFASLISQVQPPQQPAVIQVQQKPGGGVVRGTIDAAKFMIALLFLLGLGTCVYVCGSAASSSSSSSSR